MILNLFRPLRQRTRKVLSKNDKKKKTLIVGFSLKSFIKLVTIHYCNLVFSFAQWSLVKDFFRKTDVLTYSNSPTSAV